MFDGFHLLISRQNIRVCLILLLLRKTVIILGFGELLNTQSSTMKLLSRAFSRGISVQEILCYGFYTVIGLATLNAFFITCSDDGKAVGSSSTITSSKSCYIFIS